VKLLAGGEFLGNSNYPVKVTLMEGDLPINTNDCGMSVFLIKTAFLTRLKTTHYVNLILSLLPTVATVKRLES